MKPALSGETFHFRVMSVSQKVSVPAIHLEVVALALKVFTGNCVSASSPPSLRLDIALEELLRELRRRGEALARESAAYMLGARDGVPHSLKYKRGLGAGLRRPAALQQEEAGGGGRATSILRQGSFSRAAACRR
jgi:hypothetical protein